MKNAYVMEKIITNVDEQKQKLLSSGSLMTGMLVLLELIRIRMQLEVMFESRSSEYLTCYSLLKAQRKKAMATIKRNISMPPPPCLIIYSNTDKGKKCAATGIIIKEINDNQVCVDDICISRDIFYASIRNNQDLFEATMTVAKRLIWSVMYTYEKGYNNRSYIYGLEISTLYRTAIAIIKHNKKILEAVQ